ncbi:AMP-binding protein [Gaoshiqia sp. Z1-71]|uniref:AMP-binding protein n=1 Tax=Gaoshiqia hydrogeniformans TaxID=3290090 RepID=UPI003BF8F63A
MNLFPHDIKLNGQLFPVAELLRQKRAESDWEREWIDFLSEWYNGKDFIAVNTSGSTGAPKAIRLKKEFVAASARRTISYFGLNENDPVLHCLPARYIAGKLMVVRALIGKLDMHLLDPSADFAILRHPELFTRSAMPFKFAAMVINQVDKLWNLPDWNLEFLLLGGSAIPSGLEEKLQRVKTRCFSSYAMTETATHVALRKLNGEGADGFYHCLDEIRVSLSDEACLQILMPGLDQAFLQTTDLAELKDDKTFRILGRADHVIISGGIKFSPEELEKKLEPFISEPFVISSLPHETLGRQLILVVEGAESKDSIARLQAICSHQLDKYERPRDIRMLNELPRTPNGKINRKAVFAD